MEEMGIIRDFKWAVPLFSSEGNSFRSDFFVFFSFLLHV